MVVLPAVLSSLDLPEAELRAARLDGEVISIGDGFGCIDEIVTAAHRARSLAIDQSGRLVAERRTAAWIFGAITDAPIRPELCTDIGARYRIVSSRMPVPREVVLADHDVVEVGGRRVTSPLRTAIDIARTTVLWTAVDAATIERLAAIGGFTLREALADLDSHHHLPYKTRAAHRLSAGLTTQETRR